MRKYLITTVFILLLLFSVVLFIGPADTESILSENREPQAMPKFSLGSALSGSFEADFDQYVNDNTAWRSQLMQISGRIRALHGSAPKGSGRIISTTSDLGTGETLDGRLMLLDDAIMEMFTARPEIEIKYAETLNAFRTALPADITLYSMLIPTRLAFCDTAYAGAQDSQKTAIDTVYTHLDGQIQSIDVYSHLQKAAETEDTLYFKTDHHWTSEGAYYAYEAFSLAAGHEVKPKDAYERRETGEFYGSLYAKAKSELPPDPPKDVSFYYDTAKNGDFYVKMRAEDNVTEYAVGSPVFRTDRNDYGVFFGGDNPFMEIRNNHNPNGKTLLIIKDSYANALIPWLIQDYRQILVIDPRSYGGSLTEEIETYNVDEVMFVNYVFSATFSDYCDIVRSLLG